MAEVEDLSPELADTTDLVSIRSSSPEAFEEEDGLISTELDRQPPGRFVYPAMRTILLCVRAVTVGETLALAHYLRSDKYIYSGCWGRRREMLRKASATQVVAAQCSPEAIKWKPTTTKIYTMVPFTWKRCLLFLFSITLYATDIVRSGLGIRRVASFGNQQLGIDTFSSFGPYAYPVQTIRKEATNQSTGTTKYFGFAESEVGGFGGEIPQVKLWPYKFDTLSVGLRGLAMELDVKEYPHCMLTTFRRCSFEYLSLEQVFLLLDGLMEGIQTRLDQDAQELMVFGIQHQWVDTIEQTLFTYLRKEAINRYFTLHSYRRNATRGLAPVELVDICRYRRHRFDQPSFCSTGRWPATLPLPPANETKTNSKVNIDEHMAVRLARFQTEYPELDFQMILLTATHLMFIENSASVYYSREGEEVLTILRGRKCDSNELQAHCETIVVDEYRYERSVFDTNVEGMYGYVSFLRGTAQVYVWVRLIMLVTGIVASTWYESKHEDVTLINIVYMSWVNLLKVPSHVVVYGTVVPVVLHASAHLVDCYLYHLIVQDALTTLMGKDALMNARTDLNYVTLKMRNIWFVGLLCILIVWYRTHVRHQETWKQRMGILGFRGSIMSFLSCTSLLFPVRFPSLRQIDVLSFTWHPANWTIDGLKPLIRRDFSTATTGPFLEIRCFVLAVTTFMILVVLVRVISRLTKRSIPVVMAQSTVIPYSAGTLWSTMALTGYWTTNIHRHSRHGSRLSVVPTTTQESGSKPLDPTQPQASAPPEPRLFRRVTPTYIRALCLETRTEEMWALIRLMNIVMMTNPWVYVRLRVIGVDLFLYQLHEDALLSNPMATPSKDAKAKAFDSLRAFLLPDRIERLYEMNQVEFEGRFELLGVVNSRDLSWNQLIMCG